jgi:hypothetical protein
MSTERQFSPVAGLRGAAATRGMRQIAIAGRAGACAGIDVRHMPRSGG